jgi:hypothetical protein
MDRRSRLETDRRLMAKDHAMERLPDLILQQDSALPDVVDQGHDWYIYLTEPEGPHVEPARADHEHADREPDYVARVVCKKAFLDSPDKVYEEIIRQIKLHYRRCYA